MPTKWKLCIYSTKSPKRDNIYTLCLWMLEEHNYLVLKYTIPALHRITLG